MSKTIDERVVEMRFDNKNFESNVATSMSTLEKLKQSLNLTKASKGLENIGSAAKNLNLSGLSSGIDTVHAKFSALQVVGVTALSNITNSAINAGKRMVSALTIDPVKTGLREYETQINAVQTILANTQKEGTNVEIVNKALDELNTYADKTIYNFTEMTRNIGTFTAAGVKLDTSVNAIKGIANLAAVSGSTSQQASTAMYQLSQALAAGKVQLMDWNSVVNAGMGGQVFQDALVRTSENLKTGAKEAINTYGSFRESLTKSGWLTTEVLTETLNQLAGVYSKSELMAQGYSESQAAEIVKMAETAEAAATEVKTFTQLWDVMKESAQSGWAQTWRLIIGDFEEAKSLMTPLADFFTGENGLITKMSNARNELLESALGKGFSGLADKINGVLKPAKQAVETVKNVKTAIGDLGGIVDDVIIGKFGNGQERIDALTEAGHNFYEVQNKVNETLGCSFRYTDEQIEAQNKLLGKQKETTESTSKSAKETEKLTDAQKKQIKELAAMSDAQLRAKGYTEEQIEAFRELRKTAEKLGIPLNEFIDNLDEINGRWLLLNSFKNVGQAIAKVFSSIGSGFRQIFDPIQPEQLFNAIASIHKFTSSLIISDENAEKLTRTFKGLFAALDIIGTVLGGGVKLAFKGLSKILEAFDMNILDLTANLGDAIVKFRDFLFNNDYINKGFELIATGIVKAADAIKKLYDAFIKLPQVQKIINRIKDAFDNLKDIDLSEVGSNIIAGLKNGLENGITSVPDMLLEIGRKIISAIKGVLGIHSPSTVMFEIGKNIIEGLVNGIIAGVSWIVNAVKNVGSKIADIFGGIEWDFNTDGAETALSKFKDIFSGFDYSKLLVIIPIAAVLFFAKKLYDIGSALADGINGLNDVIESFALVGKKFAKVLDSFALSIKADALKKIATSLAILVGSVIALTFVDTDKLYSAVVVVGVLAGILVGLAFAMDKMSQASVKIGKGGASIDGFKSGLLSIAASLLLLAATVKIIGSMDVDQAKQGFIGLAGLVLALAGVFAAYGLLVKGKSAKNIDKVGSMLLKMSISLLILAGVCKLVGKLSPEEMIKGGIFVGAFVLFVGLLIKVTQGAGKHINKVGGMLVKISIAMTLMIGVCKLVGKLSPEEMIKGGAFALAFALFVGLLVKVTQVGKEQQVAKLGRLLLSVSVSLMLMVGVCKLVGKLTPAEMIKGGIFVAAFVVLIKILMKITTIGSDQQMAKVAGIILAMSIAIGLLAGVAVLLSMVPVDGLFKGVAAITVLGLMMAAMIKATQGSNKVVGNLVVMTIAIAVMAGAVAALSMIDGSKLAGATAAMGILMGMFALIAKASGTMSTSIGSLLIMTVAVGLLGGMLYVLAGLPVQSVLAVGASLSMLLLSLSACMLIISKTGTIAPTALISIGIMVLVVGLLGGILYLLKDLPVDSTLSTAMALSALLLALSGACVILSVVGLTGPAAFIGIGALVTLIAAVGGLMVAIGALAEHFPGMEEMLNKGIPILEKIGYGLGSFFGNIVGGFMDGVTSGLPDVGTNLSNFMTNLQPFIEGAKGIDETALNGVTSLAKMLALISGASILEAIASWITGESSMETFGTQLNAFADAIVSFSNKVKGNIDEEAVTAAANAGAIMAEMQNKIAPTGGVIQWFCGEKDMSTFGAQLVAFGNSIVSFSNKVKGNIDEEAVTAAANAGTLMAEMQSKIVPTGGVVQWFCGEKDMSTFGSQLVAFGNSIVQFSRTVSGNINEEAVTAAANAGSLMASMQAKIVPTGGVVQWFCGEKDMSTFGAQLVAFGDSIVQFSRTVAGNINEEAVVAAATAGGLMAELQNKLEPIGGVVDFFTGQDDLETFGSTVLKFGKSMVEFSNTVAGNINEEAVTAAATAGSIMAELDRSIPKDKWLDGKVSLDDFGEQMKSFGSSIASFAGTVSGADFSAISSSAEATKDIISVAETLNNSDIEIVNSTTIMEVGNAIMGYSDLVSDIDSSAISSSISSANRLVTLINGLAGLDTSGISSFQVKSIGESMKSYSASVADLNAFAVSSSISSAKRLIELINSMAGLDTSGVSSFKTAVNNLSTVNIEGVVKAFSGASSKLSSVGGNLIESLIKGMKSKTGALTSVASSTTNTLYKSITSKASQFMSAGSTLIAKLINGINSKKHGVKSTITSTISSAASAIRGYYSDFYNAGIYLGEGLVLGINAQQTAAYNAGFALGQKAVQGEKDGQESNSPSKATKKAGKWIGEGLVIGIQSMGTKVYKSGYKLGGTATKSISSAISKARDLIDGGIDAQPTIRPVLDLSDVRSGAGAISNLFNNRAAVGVTSNINAISSMMNDKNQNGTTNDVISAINKLRKDLNNVGGTTNYINGVTYDDGSNISTAVEEIVRAARIERRR